MQKVATNLDLVQDLDVKAIKPWYQPCNATDILAEIYLNAEARGTQSRSPYVHVPTNTGIKHMSNNYSKVSLHSKKEKVLTSIDHKGRRIRPVVLPDGTCLIQMKSRKDYSVDFIPWPFKIARDFTFGDYHMHTSAYVNQIWFTLNGEGGYDKLFPKGKVAQEKLDFTAMRAAFIDRLKKDLIKIVDAFDQALPVALGPTYLKDGLDKTAAVPPFVTRVPDCDSAKKFVADTLFPYLDAKFPDAGNIEGFIFGRTIELNGSLTPPKPNLSVDLVRQPNLEKMLQKTLSNDCSAEYLASYICQKNQAPLSVADLRWRFRGASTAHEQASAILRIHQGASLFDAAHGLQETEEA